MPTFVSRQAPLRYVTHFFY